MTAENNLLFGVLAIQVDLIDSQQFAEACALWTAKKHTSLADILVSLGWISQSDKSDVERFVQRRLKKHDGDLDATLAASATDAVHLTLSQIGDPEIKRLLFQLSQSQTSWSPSETTIDHVHMFKEGRYELLTPHGGGGVGQVWIARDKHLSRDVAIKTIRRDKAVVPTVHRRFVKEAQITGQLEHPGVVPVYELSQQPCEQPFYVMRFVKGRTLTDAIREYHNTQSQRDFLLVELLAAFVTVCNTVAYAHFQGIIHRDLKGQNIILGDFGEVIVLDWGLAKKLDETDHDDMMILAEEPSHSQLTMHGEALGTPAYMAPEQALGQLNHMDQRTDIYGLGAILYEILAGQPPFTGTSVSEVMRKVINEQPMRPSELSNDVPKNLEETCLRALSKDPTARFESANELADQVQQWQEVQRKQAIQALKDSEALYHGLVESLPMVVWRKDLEGRFTFINKGWRELYGWSDDEILGKTDFDFCPAPLAEKYRRDDERVMDTGEILELDEETELADGSRRSVRVFKTPVHNADGEVIGTQGFLWDVTEHKRTQEALQQARDELETRRQ